MSAAITLMSPSNLKRKRDKGWIPWPAERSEVCVAVARTGFLPGQYMSATGMVAKSK